MADYWKSQPRKFCDFCKCWIADNKPSREFHERGKRHQENVAKKISEVRKKGLEQAKNEKDAGDWMIQMEREALKKLREDLTADPSLASQYGVTIKSRSAETKTTRESSSADKIVEDSADGSSDWQEALSPEGYVYYWNKTTGESRWEVPEDLPQSKDAMGDPQKSKAGEKAGDSTLVEGDKTGKKSDSDSQQQQQQQQTDGATAWQQLHSAEGYPYYWNTRTGEVSWELPSSEATTTVSIKEEESTSAPAAASAPAVDDNDDEKSSSPKEASREKEKSPPKSPSEVKEEVHSAEEKEEVQPFRKRPRNSVYGEWQELKDESEPMVDLELPVDQNPTEVKTIVLAEEPKIKFKEKTVESLGVRPAGSKPVEFKKRKLNSGAAKGNIRRVNNQDT